LSTELTKLKEEVETELGYQNVHSSLVEKLLKTQEVTIPPQMVAVQ
jgi:hypothetical protein